MRFRQALAIEPSDAQKILKAAGVTLGETYPFPLVDHAEQRLECLEMYGVVKEAKTAARG